MIRTLEASSSLSFTKFHPYQVNIFCLWRNSGSWLVTYGSVELTDNFLTEFQEKPNPKRNVSTKNAADSTEKSLGKESEKELVTVDAVQDESAAEKLIEADSNNEKDKNLEPEKKNTEGETIAENKEANISKAGDKRKVPMQGKWKGFDPVVFLKDETVINGIKEFYGIKEESFPLYGHLVARNEDTSGVKRIYYVSKSVKEVLELNFAVGQQLKIASVGLKMFVSSFLIFSTCHFG